MHIVAICFKYRKKQVAKMSIIIPPFNENTATQKVQIAEDLWNTRDPRLVAKAYTEDSQWRNRAEFIKGRDEIIGFLTKKWQKELDYKLKKELWCFTGNRIAVRFEYEWHGNSGQWYRSHGNELWEFASSGLMQQRDASINDYTIREEERRIF